MEIEEIALRIKGKFPLRTKGEVEVAKHFVQHFYPYLKRYAGSFYTWTGTHYTVLDDERLPADIARAYHGFPVGAKKEDRAAWDLRTKDINAIHAALKAHCHLDARENERLPCWLSDDDMPFIASECVTFSNGILHVPSREFIDPTPNLFTVSALPHPYKPDAEKPLVWLNFLGEILDQPSIDRLQEWFGYCITEDNSLHKMLWMVGPRRCGKGTILHVLNNLVGARNVASPDFQQMSKSDFGLENLINKTNAIMGDVRFDGKDVAKLFSNLLRITGGDAIDVSQKHKIAWHGILNTRFSVASNEAPPRDNVNALDARLLFIQFTKSFVGREDFGLSPRLHSEMTEITNWALQGLDRLRANGNRFTANDEATRAIWDLVNTNKAPLAEWLGTFFEVTGDHKKHRVSTRADTFECYKRWLLGRGLEQGAECSNLQKFSTAIAKMTSGAVGTDRHEGADAYLGLCVKDASEYARECGPKVAQQPSNNPPHTQARVNSQTAWTL